ncbi:hypothetical protein CTAYLR_010189 [Chrysophaeum taylorii]|uniref:Polysaccharide pyruvyl transferase domain-containing protein n=1 Tax=Chrysophaeum taylorii TaxID=2483200 RepID=A0AAD7U7M4_9STRA|nr:hypothetical protein CTAYLR_010189 [Chrysophaeum taylorii]
MGDDVCDRAPPLTAFLVGGLARGFSQPSRFLSLRRSVVDWQAPSEIFVVVKTPDKPPDNGWVGTRPTFAPEDPAALARARDSLGPAAFEVLDEGASSISFERWATTCAQLRNDDPKTMFNNRMVGVHGYWSTTRRLIALLRAHENATARKFERLVFSRPDLVYYRTAGPWCGFGDRMIYHSAGADCDLVMPANVQCERASGVDFWWTAPRAYADVLYRVAARVLDCSIKVSNNERALLFYARNDAEQAGLEFRAFKDAHPGLAVLLRPSPPASHPGVQGIGHDLAAFGRRAGLSLRDLVYGPSPEEPSERGTKAYYTGSTEEIADARAEVRRLLDRNGACGEMKLPLYVLANWNAHNPPNFGDDLNNNLMKAILGLDTLRTSTAKSEHPHVLFVGSIVDLWYYGPGDVVIGAGSRGRARYQPGSTIARVRGPLTAALLRDSGMPNRNVDLGDPGLVAPLLDQSLPESRVLNGTGGLCVIPHFHDTFLRDLAMRDPRARFVNVRASATAVVSQIADCELVLATSLHGAILADAYGIPSFLIPPPFEPLVKYLDYVTSISVDGTGDGFYDPRLLAYAADYDQATKFSADYTRFITDKLEEAADICIGRRPLNINSRVPFHVRAASATTFARNFPWHKICTGAGE